MASSSSCAASSQSPQKHEVFISFAGQDTRPNFASHLRDALCRSTIETYIDYRIEKGDDVWSALEEAIENSTLFLIIFSEHYASSRWCLKELEKILECADDQKPYRVMPVFYKIEPTIVRKQSGIYEIAFSKHENSDHKQHVPKWRDALTVAANFKGWHCKIDTDEVELIKDIVKCVLTKLDRMYQNDSFDGLIGIDKEIADIESLLCNESQDTVQFIGIWGMGGIGKTTIATKLFRKVCFAFQSFCFLANVREESKKYGITHLKNKLLSVLLEDKEVRMGMPNGATDYDMRRLGRKKVLIVLDDINDLEQLKNLAGAHNWFGNGSRVIITTRDKKLLGKYVDNKCIYEVKALEFDNALQLFKLNAFENNYFDKDFEELSWKVVSYCKGIPLALVVLGSMLYGEDKEEWERQLKKLKKMPCPEVQQTLKLSYEGLDREEKNIILDIACHLKGRGVEEVKILLDACGYSSGLRSLQNKALVVISNNVVSMHDLIQEMGWEIVRQESLEDPRKRSRLWDPEDIYQVLIDNKGSEAIRSISLDMSKMEALNLSPQVFSKMHKLRFFDFYNSNSFERHSLNLPQGLRYLSNELKYLRWVNYPLKSLPSNFSAEKLVILNMQHSKVRRLWHGVQNVVNLKEIDLYSAKHLIELPDFSKAINLKRVYLTGCQRLREVHPSILCLDKLESLYLSGCDALTSIKSDIHLKSLSDLYLSQCSSLKEFSLTSENMSELFLPLTAINELPSFIGRLSTLEYLYLSDSGSQKNIQNNLFDASCVLFKLIENMSMLSSLKILEIEGSDVEWLPTSIKHLSSLKDLELNQCTRLRSIPPLPPFISKLSVIDCSSLEKVQFNSTTAEAMEVQDEFRTSLINCMKLDEHSVKAILAFLVLLNNLFSEENNYMYQYHNAQVIYPGSRVPEWFKYRSTNASFTIDLSSAPLSMDWSFIFCVIIGPGSLILSDCISIGCVGLIQIINNEQVDEGGGGCSDDDVDLEDNLRILSSWHIVRKWDFNHVCLWWDGIFCTKLYEIIEKSRATSNPKISLELNFYCLGEDEENEQIEECGVCPTYTWEFQNFIASAYQNNDDKF